MKNFKLLNLLLEFDENTDCQPGTKETITQREYANMPDSANYNYFKDTRSNYFKCKKKGSKLVEPKPEEKKPVVAGKCPSDEAFGNKDFQEWVWKTHLGKTETDKVTTKLCGITVGASCKYSVGVDGNCGDGTKAIWLELREKFIDFKKNNQNVVVDPDAKRKECKSNGMDYDETTKNINR